MTLIMLLLQRCNGISRGEQQRMFGQHLMVITLYASATLFYICCPGAESRRVKGVNIGMVLLDESMTNSQSYCQTESPISFQRGTDRFRVRYQKPCGREQETQKITLKIGVTEKCLHVCEKNNYPGWNQYTSGASRNAKLIDIRVDLLPKNERHEKRPASCIGTHITKGFVLWLQGCKVRYSKKCEREEKYETVKLTVRSGNRTIERCVRVCVKKTD